MTVSADILVIAGTLCVIAGVVLGLLLGDDGPDEIDGCDGDVRTVALLNDLHADGGTR